MSYNPGTEGIHVYRENESQSRVWNEGVLLAEFNGPRSFEDALEHAEKERSRLPKPRFSLSVGGGDILDGRRPDWWAIRVSDGLAREHTGIVLEIIRFLNENYS